MTGKRRILSSADVPANKSGKAIHLNSKMKIMWQYECGKKINTIAHDLYHIPQYHGYLTRKEFVKL